MRGKRYFSAVRFKKASIAVFAAVGNGCSVVSVSVWLALAGAVLMVT